MSDNLQEETESKLNSVLGLEHSSLSISALERFYFEYIREESNLKQRIIIFPQLHDQVYFSKLANQLLATFHPSVIALELPHELKDYFTRAIDRLPITTLIHTGELETREDITFPPPPNLGYVIHPGEAIYWMAHLGRKKGCTIEFVDTWHEKAFETWQIPIDYPSLATIGWKKFWELSTQYLDKHVKNPIHLTRSSSMGNKLLQLTNDFPTIIFICGAAHWPVVTYQLEQSGFNLLGEDPFSHSIREILKPSLFHDTQSPSSKSRKEWYLADIHPHSLHIVTNDLPFMIADFVDNPVKFDFVESIRNLYFEAEKNYKNQFDDAISPASYRRMFQYLRNLNRLNGTILPGLIDLVAAAKGMGDDDFAFEVYRMAVTYPFVPNKDDELEQMVKFAPDETKGEVVKFAFKRRFRRPILRKLRENERFDDLDPIPEEAFPGQWQDIWDNYSPFGMVSYPPEDVFIENYLDFLRKRINEIIMEEQASSVEFQASLEDGIDWRATTRHFHEGKIFVKKIPRKQPEIGALIVQFLEEPMDEDEYNNHSTLFAEHDKESHISVITTKPGDVMVGPGITRVKYAAIISQFPPIGWPALISQSNEDLKIRILHAAMNMSLSKIIGFVAPKPPSAAHRHFASSNGFRIVYLPMSQLTKASMHRLRTMHLLAHRSLRDNAREYIGF
ncbi:MAG: hypothetical protein ACXAD7_10520 [Candidatus Kariarchaeaceae archaeon]